MCKNTKVKLCGSFYFLTDILVQGVWIFGVDQSGLINKYCLDNSFLLLCFAVGIFGESKLLGRLALIGMLIAVFLTVKFWVGFFKKKESFSVPLFLTVVNVVVHAVAYWKDPTAYVGLLCKLIGCVIYAYLVYRKYADRDKCKLQNQQ